MKKIVSIFVAIAMMLSCSEGEKFETYSYTYEFTPEASSVIIPASPNGSYGIPDVTEGGKEVMPTNTDYGVLYDAGWMKCEIIYAEGARWIERIVVRVDENTSNSERNAVVHHTSGTDIVLVNILQKGN